MTASRHKEAPRQPLSLPYVQPPVKAYLYWDHALPVRARESGRPEKALVRNDRVALLVVRRRPPLNHANASGPAAALAWACYEADRTRSHWGWQHTNPLTSVRRSAHMLSLGGDSTASRNARLHKRRRLDE